MQNAILKNDFIYSGKKSTQTKLPLCENVIAP